MGLWQKLFGAAESREAAALYEAVVARARQPHWYVAGGVPDTIDGRFDMVAAVMSMVLLRLERDVDTAAELSASLAECFIEDMDGQLRQQGVGDIMVGKHIGRMMGMLGGRLGAYRDGIAAGAIDAALVRNVWREQAPDAHALAHTRAALLALYHDVGHVTPDDLRQGRLP